MNRRTSLLRSGVLSLSGIIGIAAFLPPGHTVAVTPDGTFVTPNPPANTGPFQAYFFVNNTGSYTDSYVLWCAGRVNITCAGTDLTYLTLDPGQQSDVEATYTTGAPGTGRLVVGATGAGNPAADSGYYRVTVQSNGAPVITLRNHHRDHRDRSLCLTSGAGEAAAWQCGDLLISHGLPAYATMGRERSLTLVYNSSQGAPRSLVAATVSQSGIGAPSTVFVRVAVNGVGRDSATYSGWGTPTPVRQVALTYSASGDTSGLYPFTFTVRNQYAGGSYEANLTDTLMVVNRSVSPFGSGWWLAGVEQLILAPGNNVLWVGGEGSAKVYRNVATNTWVAAAGAFRDTLRFNTGTSTYTRHLRHGVTVTFDASGRHIQTKNRTGQITKFNWSGSPLRLTTIKVPPDTSVVYTLTYASDPARVLDYITDPAGRVLNATVTSGQLVQLVDPDTTSYHTAFTYDAALPGRMISRTTRRGYTTTFTYANGLRVTKVTVPVGRQAGDTATSVTTFTPWDERGLAVGSGNQTAVDTAKVYTKIDGPRTGVADTALFWIDRWGAPTRIRDPIGGITKVTRADTTALVTRLDRADNSIALMTWNARGNLLQLRDSTWHLADSVRQATVVRRWTYPADTIRQDSPDSVRDSTETGILLTRFAYNSWGLLDSAIAPNGHRTRFEYVMTGALTGLVRAVLERKVPAWDTTSKSEPVQTTLRSAFAFNTLGNVVSDTSPMGRVRTYTRDAFQRVSNVYDAGGHRVELVYDALNRMRQSIQHVEGVDSGFTEPLVTRQYFGLDVLDSITDHRRVARGYRYDAANRRIAEVDDYGHWESIYYDRSGLVDSVRLRLFEHTAGVTRHVYDAAGRTLKTAWPANSPLAADSIQYTYDLVGRMLSATQSNRRVVRTYYGTGALRSEVQSNADSTSPITLRYAYDRVGRRTWYRLGTAGNLTYSDSVWYRYDATSGDLLVIGVRWRRAYGPGTQPIKYDSVRFRWDSLGRRDSVVYSNGTRVQFAYDADGQVRLVCGTHPSGPTNFDVFDFTNYDQTVDQDGMIRGTTTHSTGLSGCSENNPSLDVLTMTYDSRHQLRTRNAAAGWEWNVYDGSGNLVRVKTNIADKIHVVDSLHNRLTRWYHAASPGSGTNYTYDSSGSRYDELPFCPGCDPDETIGRRSYYYDGLGRTTGTEELGCIEDPETGSCEGEQWSGSSAACRYDPVGHMYDPCENGAPNLGFDGENVAFTGGSDGALYTWTFVHGPGVDDPIMGYYHSNDASNDKYWYYVTDGQGRQFGVGDGAGYNMTTDLAYYQNGGKLAGGTKNAASFGADRFHNPEMYRLSFFRNRFYDQQTGRWTQEDPIGVAGGNNLYAYVGNNPTAYTDPFGLCPEWKDGIPCVNPVPGFMTAANAKSPSGAGGSEWGYTRSLGTEYHNGFDQAAPHMTAVVAPGAGELRIGTSEKDGLYAQLNLGNGTSVTFSHLSSALLPAGLKPGDAVKVKAGETIAFTGQSGNAQGSNRDPHVHITTKVKGESCNPRDFFSRGGGSCKK
jgi:RHS repeat-associated protein